MVKQVQYKIASFGDLHEAAKRINACLADSAVVALTGELGSGKTTLVQTIARLRGLTESVPSPTFTLVNEYHVASGLFVHADLYRLVEASEMTLLGLSDYFAIPNVVTFVEWADRLPALFPPATLWLRFALIEGDMRILTCTCEDESRLRGLIAGSLA